MRRRDRNWNRVSCFALIAAFLLLLPACSPREERVRNARDFIRQWNYDRALTELISYRRYADPEIQYLLGFCYLKKNELGEAQTYFGRSLSLDSTFRDSIIKIYNDLAQNALRINEPERALTMYRMIEELLPGHVQSRNLFLVADLNYAKGNYPQAMLAYFDAFARDSTSDIARKAMRSFINALIECDSLKKAYVLAQIEYANLKTAANLHQLNNIKYRIGQRMAAAGFPDSALILFNAIVHDNEPRSLVDKALFNIGEIHFAGEDYGSALDAYKKVLRLNPYEKGEIVAKTKNRIREIKERM